jgi:hypothetical protein
MPKFKKGDIVRVHENVFSTFKDRIGIIDIDPIDDAFDCIVKFKIGGQTFYPKFAPEDIELVDELQGVSTTSIELNKAAWPKF